ncbi:MAG: A/G-specific adenine glycosylase [Oscillospiraceae bacterium]|nr:A/G-specific adenine glycosylase [Oscillospiraceae bacterium]
MSIENTERLPEAISLLLEWYSASRRLLPWRQDPTPYHTWISEIMLQQTRIEAVIPYYERFLQEIPDIPSLAAVPEDRLMKLWEGLGYYSRARNLKKAAQILTEHYGGALPASAEELRKLPGIGDYTAGAIASISFGLPEPAVDGNVLRVLTRLFACPDDIAAPAVKCGFTELLRADYPSGEAAAMLTQAIMELGETVCLPNGVPLCRVCPLRRLCRAHESGAELDYPVKSSKKPRRLAEKTVFLLCHEGRFAIRKRPGKGLLAGLWEFPNTEGKLSPEEVRGAVAALGLTSEHIEPFGEAKHIFTHVEWHMTGYRIDCAQEPPDLLWKTPEEIARDYSLPTAFRAYQKKIGGVE